MNSSHKQGNSIYANITRQQSRDHWNILRDRQYDISLGEVRQQYWMSRQFRATKSMVFMWREDVNDV